MASKDNSVWEHLEGLLDEGKPSNGKPGVATVRTVKRYRYIGKPEKSSMHNEVDSRCSDIAAQLADYRIRLGLSLNEVARRAGTSASSISSVEKGELGLTLKRLFKYADALGLKTKVSFEPIRKYYDTLDLLERIPDSPRRILMTLVENRQEALVLDTRNVLCQQNIVSSCETAIREVLSLFFEGDALENAYRMLIK